MIYTVTLNPSLDYVLEVKDFTIGVVNRSENEEIHVGGKGINVSIVLNRLEIENIALGFIAGFTGKVIEEKTKNMGYKTEFIQLEEGLSRINVILQGQETTEINSQGPVIPEDAMYQLYSKLGLMKEGDILVLAGSVPKSLSEDIYENMIKRYANKNINFVVDATNQLLRNVLKYEPFLVKPNHHELGELYGVQLATKEEVITYARKLKEEGAKNVLVSMASMGAVLIDENENEYYKEAPEGKVINSVGAGDSMVAGFLTGYDKFRDYEQAFYYGIAAGSASAFSKNLATKEKVEELYQAIRG